MEHVFPFILMVSGLLCLILGTIFLIGLLGQGICVVYANIANRIARFYDVNMSIIEYRQHRDEFHKFRNDVDAIRKAEREKYENTCVKCAYRQAFEKRQEKQDG